MPAGTLTEHRLQISEPTCEWTVRGMSALRRRLGVNVRLHHAQGALETGQIFLFNHFARFETFIPQYLIYQHTGAYSRSIASAELFSGEDAFANYLLKLGAVPNNYPRLLPLLAEEILRGRKVIVFPEGGLVKNRQVLDHRGRFSVYSPSAARRRKHHAGAAVLALVLDAFKGAVLSLDAAGDRGRLEYWVERLRLPSTQALVAAARRPTLLIPANITFYPIRVSDNLLRKGVELFNKGLSESLSEELRVEGNILLKRTDMDLRLGQPIHAGELWSWWERRLANRLVRRVDSLDAVFALRSQAKHWDERLLARDFRRKSAQVRDTYMRRMYTEVTVNLSHLASRLILAFVERGSTEVSKGLFHTALYLALKYVQAEPSIHLHESLSNPDAYAGLCDGECSGLRDFFNWKVATNLVEVEADRYRFLPRLLEEHEWHRVRLENPICVYANEVAPVSAAVRAVQQAVRKASKIDAPGLARLLFEDELAEYAVDKAAFAGVRHAEINRQQTATADAAPYLLVPKAKSGLGVVLVHGFLASPAELRGFAHKLLEQGHVVLGVRLKGHGTSPWDLHGRKWQDWLASVRRGYRIVSAYTNKVCLVGFSVGGGLALRLAAEQPEKLAGVAAVCAPLKFRNRNMAFVPIVDGANQLARWSAAGQGPMPFRVNSSEHPEINYRHMPIRALREVSRLVEEIERRLGEVRCPVTLLQASDDPIVEPKSVAVIHRMLGSSFKTMHLVRASRHGILHDDIGDTQQRVLAFTSALVASRKAPREKASRDSSVQGKYPWCGAYPAEVEWVQELPVTPLPTVFEAAQARFATRPCVDFLGKKYTYLEIGSLVDRAAKGLESLGVGKGTKVGLCLPNTPHFIVCYHAILKTGATVVNFNPLYVEQELEHQVEDSHTDIMVTLDLIQIYPKVASLLGRTRLKRVIVCRLGDVLPAVKGVLFSVLKRSELASVPTDTQHVLFSDLIDNEGGLTTSEIDAENDLAVLQYTGGTTGVAKAAMLTHANLAANLAQVRAWFPGLEEGGERMLGVLPLFHVFAMTVAMNLGLACGAEIILHPRFELKRVLRTIQSKRATLFPGVPTIYTAIANSNDVGKYNLSSLKVCLSGGAGLPLETKRRFEELTGCHLVEGYGLSEASPVVTCNPIGARNKAGSIGVPLPNTVVEIRSLEKPAKVLPPGSRGEICIRGPQVMKGYWQRSEETAETFVDGCLRTGDVGYIDEEGYIFLIDRLKELIICNGYNVYPRVIEEAIYQHPAIDEVTVIGVSDSHRGECPKAFVKLRESHSLSETELREFLQDKLSRIERPRFIEFRDELPKTLIGKLSKKELVAEEQAASGDAGIAA